jgi:hypothetical protein
MTYTHTGTNKQRSQNILQEDIYGRQITISSPIEPLPKCNTGILLVIFAQIVHITDA